MNRPKTTLFMLQSIDGKISTGPTDKFDFDQDLPLIPGVKEGLFQYYAEEQETDLWSLNSGRTMAKIGINTCKTPEKTPVNFVVIDQKHLTAKGVDNLAAKANRLVIVTSNKLHPAYFCQKEASNISILYNDGNFLQMLSVLYLQFGCKHITIQTGGELNGVFLREKLIDDINVIIAPLLIGGFMTSTLVDGPEVQSLRDLQAYELKEYKLLNHSYVQLKYSRRKEDSR